MKAGQYEMAAWLDELRAEGKNVEAIRDVHGAVIGVRMVE